MTRTTYCIKHGVLEDVEHVKTVKPFEVQATYIPRAEPFPTGRIAVEVRAVTNKGCNVRFVGSGWKKGAA